MAQITIHAATVGFQLTSSTTCSCVGGSDLLSLLFGGSVEPFHGLDVYSTLAL